MSCCSYCHCRCTTMLLLLLLLLDPLLLLLQLSLGIAASLLLLFLLLCYIICRGCGNFLFVLWSPLGALNETCHESCIVFASLYGKPRVARNGNNAEINSRRGKLCGKFLVQIVRNSPERKKYCTQFPEMEIIPQFFSFQGNCVQICTGWFPRNSHERKKIHE